MEKAKFRIPVFANVKALNSSVRIIKNTELQCLERLKYRTPMFGKTNKIYNQSSVWNSQNSNVENAKIQNCDVWMRQNTEILNSVWKGKILEFECLRKAKH